MFGTGYVMFKLFALICNTYAIFLYKSWNFGICGWHTEIRWL